MSETSDIIKSLRSAPYNLSQTEIFRQTGITQSRISRWEAEIGTYGADDVLKLVALQQRLREQFEKPIQADIAVSPAAQGV